MMTEQNSQAEMLLIVGETGDVAVRNDESKSYILQGTDTSILSHWQELLSPTDAVQTVFGRSGTVTAQANDYTWAQIDKTVSSLADITTKSHTVLSDIGDNTHPQIDTALTRLLNTTVLEDTDLFFAIFLKSNKLLCAINAPL
jgi:hypothetical protein